MKRRPRPALFSEMFARIPDTGLRAALTAPLRLLLLLVAAAAVAWPAMVEPNPLDQDPSKLGGQALFGLFIFFPGYAIVAILSFAALMLLSGTPMVAAINRVPFVLWPAVGLVLGYFTGHWSFVHDGRPAL